MGRTLVLSALSISGLGILGALLTLLLPPNSIGPLPSEALLLPGDSTYVAGIEVRRVATSAVFSKYLKGTAALSGLRSFASATGLDPERDVDKAVFAGRGADPGVLLVIGRFDRPRLEKALDASTSLTSVEVHGRKAYRMKPGPFDTLVLLDSRSVLLGTPSSVDHALSSAAPLRSNRPLVELLGRVKPGSSVWIVGDETLLASLPKAPGGFSLQLPALKSLVATGDLEPEVAVQITAEAADAAAAQNLADMVRGGASLLLMQASARGFADLASALAVSSEGNRVIVNGRLPQGLLDSISGKLGAPSPEAR